MRRRDEALSATIADAAGGESDPQFVTALARGLDVLRAFRPGQAALGNQELARETGLPKATVSRITYTLARLGYLTYAPQTGKYAPAVGALSLGFSALGSLGIRDAARPLMQRLADYCGLAVALGTRDRMSMVYVEHCMGDSPVSIGLTTGSHIKLATSAMGRAYLCGLPEADRAVLMEQLAAREGGRWPDMRAGIEAALDEHRRLGFVLSTGAWKAEVNAVGVPLALGTGALHFALNCGGPAFLMPRDRILDDIGPRLLAVAQELRERVLG